MYLRLSLSKVLTCESSCRLRFPVRSGGPDQAGRSANETSVKEVSPRRRLQLPLHKPERSRLAGYEGSRMDGLALREEVGMLAAGRLAGVQELQRRRARRRGKPAQDGGSQAWV